MADIIYAGGSTFVVTRSEASQTDQSKYGTYNSGGTDDKRLLATNFTSNMKNNMLSIYTLGGGRSYAQIIPGKFESSGTLEFDVQNLSFLKYAFGAVSTSSQATTDFDGTTITGTPTAALKRYALTQSDVLDSFSMDVTSFNTTTSGSVDISTRYTGVKNNQVSIKADTENPLHATADWIAQKPTTTISSATLPTTLAYGDVPKMFYQGKLLIEAGDYGPLGTGSASTMTDATKNWTSNQWATNWVLIDSVGAVYPITSNTATALTVTGTPTTGPGPYTITPKSTYATGQVVQCNSIDITITNNLESYWSISNDTGRGIKFALEKQREYTLTLDLNFVNGAPPGRFYTAATSGLTPTTTSVYTPFSVVLDYRTATADGDAFKALRLFFSGVVFDEESLPANPKDILKQTITAKARDCMGFFITNETQ